MHDFRPQWHAALAAAVLGLGLPAVAAAQSAPVSTSAPSTNLTPTDPSNMDTTTLAGVLRNRDAQTRALLALGGVGSSDIGIIPVPARLVSGSMNVRGSARSSAALQNALGKVMVDEAGGSPGSRRTLADHLTSLGVDPKNVIAVAVDPKTNLVTVYTLGPIKAQSNGGS